MPVISKNKDANIFVPKDIEEYQGKDFEIINGKIVKNRTEHQGDGFMIESTSAVIKMVDSATGYDKTVSGNTSGYAVYDSFNRTNNNNSLGTPTSGSPNTIWKNKRGTFGVSGNKAHVASHSVIGGDRSVDYSSSYAGMNYNITTYNAGITRNFIMHCYLENSVTSGALSSGIVFRANSDLSDFYTFKKEDVSQEFRISRFQDFNESPLGVGSSSVATSLTASLRVSGDGISAYINNMSCSGTPFLSTADAFIYTSASGLNTYFGLITNKIGSSITSYTDHYFEDFQVIIPESTTGIVQSLINYPSGIRYESVIEPNKCEENILDDVITSFIHGSSASGMEMHDLYMELKHAGYLNIYGGRFYYNSKTCNSVGDSYLEINSNGIFLYKDGVLTFGLDAQTGNLLGNFSYDISGGDSSGSGGSDGASGISGNAAQQSGTSGISGNASSGISGNATSGISGSASSGTSGVSGFANSGTSGISGSASSGISGNSSSGVSGISGSASSGTSGVSGSSSSGTSGVSGNATSGISGSATSGTSGVSGNSSSGTSGVSGSATSGTSGISGNAAQQSGASGISGSATSGISGNATSGISGNATSGMSGVSGLNGASQSGLSGVSGNSSSGTSGVSGNATSGTSGISGNAAQQSGTSGISGNATSGTSGVSGSSSSGTSGVSGNATSGTSGVSGNSSSGTSGVSGNATSGTSGVSGNSSSGTSGVSGNATSGTSGISGSSAAGSTYFTWNTSASTAISATVNNAYILTHTALQTVTLPTTAAIGDRIKLVGVGTGKWKIAQNASELIRFGNALVTTTGIGGFIQSLDQNASIELVCVVADTEWEVIQSDGDIISDGNLYVSQMVSLELLISCNMDNSVRWTTATLASGATIAFGLGGLEILTSATIGGNGRASYGSIGSYNFFTGNVEVSIIAQVELEGTDYQSFWGMGRPTTGAAGLTMTDRHIGFEIQRSGGTTTLYATCGDGATQTSTAITALLAGTDQVFQFVKIGTSSVRFYLDGVLKTTITTNIPTTAPVSLFGVCATNRNTASQTIIGVSEMHYVRRATQ